MTLDIQFAYTRMRLVAIFSRPILPIKMFGYYVQRLLQKASISRASSKSIFSYLVDRLPQRDLILIYMLQGHEQSSFKEIILSMIRNFKIISLYQHST